MIKITENSKLLIWGNSKEVRSGGAEVLNFLASYLKKLGVDAKMFNWSMLNYEQPDYYKRYYDVNCGSWKEVVDDENLIVLLPEIMIENPENMKFFLGFKKTQFIIWWLSSGFDYADKEKKTSKRLIMDKLKLFSDRVLHLYENEICSRDLIYYGNENKTRLQHGVNQIFYDKPSSRDKENIVMYNAIKPGTRDFVENTLIPIMPDVKFDGIYFNGPDRFLTKEELIEHYDAAKVYIDFCGFEGRELMPREAVLRDCILILGREGCAATFDDYPIPDWYKVNKYDNPEEIASKIRTSLDEYNIKFDSDFGFFKNRCVLEPELWKYCIYSIFGPMIKKDFNNI